MVNVGIVESCAIMVYLAADKRFAMEQSTFLIHNFTRSFPSNSVDYPRLEEASESLRAYADIYTNIVNDRTHGAECQIDVMKHLRGEACRINPALAVKSGIVHGIIKFPEIIKHREVNVPDAMI